MDVGWWMLKPWLTPCSMQISRIGVYGPKAGDHLFYIGSAKRKDEDISFFALVRNLKPITKHILFKSTKWQADAFSCFPTPARWERA